MKHSFHRLLAILTAAAVAGVLICYGLYQHFCGPDVSRLPIILVNETDDHQFDRSLRSTIRTAQNVTGFQWAVVLKKEVPEPLKTYAPVVFKENDLGRLSNARAILFLLSEKDHELKIEVSYELEGIFPDILCHQLEQGARTFMLSQAKFARRDFLTELFVTMGIYYENYQKGDRDQKLDFPLAAESYALSHFLSGGAGLVGRHYSSSIEDVKKELRRLPKQIEAQYRASQFPQETLNRYLLSLQAGIGDPNLPLLTEGSKYFRIEKPLAPGYIRRIFDYYQKATPYDLKTKGKLAAVKFQIHHPVLPILMRQNDEGLWLIDEAKSWAYFHLFENLRDPVAKYQDHPFAFVWENSDYPYAYWFLYRNESKVPPLLEFPYSLQEKLEQAEARVREDGGAKSYFALADLIYFEMYWLEAAAPLYEKGFSLDKKRLDYAWRLLDVYRNTSNVDGMMTQYLRLFWSHRSEEYFRTEFIWFLKTYEITFIEFIRYFLKFYNSDHG